MGSLDGLDDGVGTGSTGDSVAVVAAMGDVAETCSLLSGSAIGSSTARGDDSSDDDDASDSSCNSWSSAAESGTSKNS